MQSLCYNGKHIDFFDPSQPRDEHGRWTGGGSLNGVSKSTNQINPEQNEKVEKSKHNRVGSALWGSSKSNSYEMTGYSSSLMGIEGFKYKSEWNTSPLMKKDTEKILTAINNDNIGSEESTFHGFQNTKNKEYFSGDEIKIPLTATTSDAEEAEGFGISRLKGGQLGDPTVFHFPKGTKIAAYNINKKKEDIKDFGLYGEAITAGKFKVDKVTSKTISKWYEDKQAWEPLSIKVVTLKQKETFNPNKKSWEKSNKALEENTSAINFYDPSQVRDEHGRWTSGGSSGSSGADTTTKSEASSNGTKTTTVYHGTSADVLKKIRENGLQPSKDGVYGKGVYATDHLEVALEYGVMKASDAPKIGGKSYIGLIEVVSKGFEEVSKYTDPTRKTRGDKKGDSISILLKKNKVEPSEIKSMSLFDLKDVRSWIFEGGKKPSPVATKHLETKTYYIPIVIHETEITKLEEPKCPLPTQDIKENLANRQKAIDVAHYGPANPKEPNEEYWKAKAKIFNGSVEEAKTMRCGNCAGFNQTTKLTECISKGIGTDAKEVEQAGDLGYCEIFDFKCASLRTCDAWIVGGPITDKTDLQKFKEDLLELKKQGAILLFDPSQPRDDSGRWSGSGGSSLSDKLTAKIAKENPDIDLKDSKVKKAIQIVSKGVEGARIKVQYGASKVNDIRNWIKSEKGQAFIKGTTDALKITSKGIVEAGREWHNERFSILASAIASIGTGPELVIAKSGYALLKGFVRGAVGEYRNIKHPQGTEGREISNTIRGVAGLKPMEACNSVVMLKADPTDEDLIDYLTDVLAVSIKDKIRGTKTFEVTSFAFDPSQARDESGRWVSQGGSGGEKKKEPEMPIYDEDENKPKQPIKDTPKEIKKANEITEGLNEKQKEVANGLMSVIGPFGTFEGSVSVHDKDTEYKEDVREWSKALEKNNMDNPEALHSADVLSAYAQADHQDINEALRLKEKGFPVNKNELKRAERVVELLDIAPKVEENEIWRGIKSVNPDEKDYTHKLAKNAKVGGIIKDAGFSSFSLDEGVAKDFSAWPSEQTKEYTFSSILLKVTNAKGIGVKMPLFATPYISEKEVLLPPKSRLKITKVETKKYSIPDADTWRTSEKYVYRTQIEAKIIK